MIWFDTYTPKTFDELTYNNELTQKLKNIINNGVNSLPHLIFHGAESSGKQTRINCLLREIYGSENINNTRIETISFKTSSSRTTDINVKSSLHHLEINPSYAGYYDKLVIKDIVDKSQFKNIYSFDEKYADIPKFRIVVIYEADKLTKQAQHSLRMTMERYVENFRFILCCNSISKLTEPLRSRCLQIRVACPTNNDIISILEHVWSKEKDKENDDDDNDNELETKVPNFEKIVEKSEHNLRRALLMLQSNKIKAQDWELYLDNIAEMILKNQNSKTILLIRDMMYELLTSCVPETEIIKTLSNILYKKVKSTDDIIKKEIISLAAHYEQDMKLSQTPVYYIEAFVIKIMILIN